MINKKLAILWKAENKFREALNLACDIMKDVPGFKFRYEKIPDDEVILPSEISIKADKVLNYCRAKFKLPRLRIQWIEIKTRQDPGDIISDFPIAGRTESSTLLLINAGILPKEIPLTIAHESHHAFMIKNGRYYDESWETTAESTAYKIIEEMESLGL